MPRKPVDNWKHAAEDGYTRLTEVDRVYPKAKMVAVIDELCLKGSATQRELLETHEPSDMIGTALGHVTTGVHGPGAVPKVDGWYWTTKDPHTYHVDPRFAEAWIAIRRLRRP